MALSSGSMVGPYEIVSPLGAGGMGEVYLARDPRLNRKIAIKILPTANAEREQRFEQEAIAASALNHPNIITIYEIGDAEWGRFIAMELVEGRTLRELVAEGLPLDRLAPLGAQMARALAVAHDARIVHRDVKPENVMVREDGYLKILDFGIARVMTEPSDETRTALTEHGMRLGTLAYMSPEQTRGEPLTGASDVFSLGVVLYEMATGRHPFNNTASKIGLLAAIAVEPPVRPSLINAEVPPTFEALILQMLEKDARLRPEARTVAATLDALDDRTAAAAPRVSPQVRRETVGREAERALIAEACATVAGGRGLMIGVAADAGIGKTTFVDDVLAGLGPEWIVARGRCSERLAGTEAYLPFLEAFETLLRGADRTTTVAVAKATAPNWYLQVMPLASTADDTSGVRLLEARATSQERLKREMGSVLAELTRLKPLVLFFDDLHWADASTIDLVAYLATRFDTMRVLVLATLRPAELQIAKHPFLQVKPTLLSRGCYREIDLGFLSKEEVTRYLAAQFPGHEFPPTVAAMIHARTEGYPLFMADLTRYLRDRGIVGERDGRWQLLAPLPEIDSTLPDTVLGMVQRKIDQVPDNDRQLLSTASVQGYEFDSAVMSRATGEDPSAVEERLEALERVYGIVRAVAEQDLPDRSPNLRYRFVHGLYQNALYRSLRPTRRVTLSATVAQALLASYGEAHATIASDLAHLFEAARDSQKAAHYFLLAAQNALRVFAHREVALLASRGLEGLKGRASRLEPDADEIGLQSLLAIARTATLGLGHTDTGAAFERLRELTQAAGNEPRHFQALSGLFFFDLLHADLAQARRTGEQLVGMAEAQNDPLHLAGAYYAFGQVLNFMGDLAPALDFEDRAIAAHEPQYASRYWSMYPFNPGLYAMVDSARTLWLLGFPDRGLRRARGAVAEARATRDLRSLPQTILLSAAQHLFRREPLEAREVAQECLDLCEQHELPLEGAWTRFVLGWTSAKLGTGDAIAGMRAALHLLETFNARVGVKTYFGLLMADVLIDAGDLDGALTFLREGLAFADLSGDRQWESEQHRLIGEVRKLQGDLDGSDAAIRHAIDIAVRQGALSLELRATASLVRLRSHNVERERLAGLIGRFTEGFDTPDLVEARALIGGGSTPNLS